MALTNELYRVLAGAGFDIRDIWPLSCGDDSDAYLCDDVYVMKVPKREAVKKTQALEFQLYRFLEPFSFPCEIPKVIYQGEAFNMMTYIKGERLAYENYHKLSEKEKDRLACDEAEFLIALHSVEIPDSHPLYSELKLEVKDRFLQDQKNLLTILKAEKLLTPGRQAWVERIYRDLLDMDFLFAYRPCLTHNDYSADNMLYQKNRLTGVIDFGDAVIGDPDNDFLCLLDNSTDDFGKDFGRRVLRYYGHPHPELAERKAEINDAYWPVQQILLGHSRKEAQLFEEGIRDLEMVRF